MAYCRVGALPEMDELSDAEAIEIITEGMKVLEPEVKKNLKSVIKGTSEDYYTHDEKANLADNISIRKSTYKKKRCMVLSFKGSVTRKNKNAKADGKTERVVNRDLIATVLEYGKKDQPPTHFLRDSLNNKQIEINTVMKRKFKEIVEQRRK